MSIPTVTIIAQEEKENKEEEIVASQHRNTIEMEKEKEKEKEKENISFLPVRGKSNLGGNSNSKSMLHAASSHSGIPEKGNIGGGGGGLKGLRSGIPQQQIAAPIAMEDAFNFENF